MATEPELSSLHPCFAVWKMWTSNLDVQRLELVQYMFWGVMRNIRDAGKTRPRHLCLLLWSFVMMLLKNDVLCLQHAWIYHQSICLHAKSWFARLPIHLLWTNAILIYMSGSCQRKHPFCNPLGRHQELLPHHAVFFCQGFPFPMRSFWPTCF